MTLLEEGGANWNSNGFWGLGLDGDSAGGEGSNFNSVIGALTSCMNAQQHSSLFRNAGTLSIKGPILSGYVFSCGSAWSEDSISKVLQFYSHLFCHYSDHCRYDVQSMVLSCIAD